MIKHEKGLLSAPVQLRFSPDGLAGIQSSARDNLRTVPAEILARAGMTPLGILPNVIILHLAPAIMEEVREAARLQGRTVEAEILVRAGLIR